MITDYRRPGAPRVGETTKASAASRAPQTETRWVLNTRLLLWTLAIVAVLATGLHFVNAYLVRRNASLLLAEADKHEADEKWMLAAADAHRYLQLCPDDAEATARRARYFDKGATTEAQRQRAAQLYAAAVALAPEREDLRTRHMELILETGDFVAALREADAMLEEAPAAASRVRALALEQQRRSRGTPDVDTLIGAFQAAIAHNPSNVELATGLASLYRDQARPTAEVDRDALNRLADGVMDHLVATSQQPATAFLARALYRIEHQLPGAEADLGAARAADSQKTEFLVWWNSGQQEFVAAGADQAGADQTADGKQADAALAAEKERRLNDAATFFQTAIDISSGDRRGYLGLGRAYLARGNQPQAIDAWKSGLRRGLSDDIELRLLIVGAQVRQLELEGEGRKQQDLPELDRGLDELEKLADRLVGPDRASILSWVFFYRGAVAESKGDLAAAVPRFRQSLQLTETGAVAGERAARIGDIELRLAKCYAAQSAWDQAARSAQHAAELRSEPGIRLTAANAWRAAGRLDEAVAQFQEALRQDADDPNALVGLVEAECMRQRELPAEKRDWSQFKEALANARSKAPLAAILAIVVGEYQAEQGAMPEAVATWQAVEPAIVSDVALCRRLLFDYQRHGRPDCADRFLVLLEKRNPSDASGISALDRALLASETRFSQDRHEEALRLLAGAMPEADAEGRRELLFRQAMILLNDGELDRAGVSLRRLAEEEPDKPRALIFLAELALQSGTIADAIGHITKLEKLEGAEGTNWRYYRAQRMLAQANQLSSKSDDPPSEEAKTLLRQATALQRQIEQLRPEWAPGYLLQAKIALSARESDEPSAIQAYTKAIQLGQRNAAIYQDLVVLLCRQNRIAEADVYMDRLRELAKVPPEMAGLAMAIDVRQGHRQRAIESAREQLAANLDDALAHLRLGELLALEESPDVDRDREAESEMRRSTELAPDDLRTWSTLLAFYLRRAKPGEGGETPVPEILSKARQLLEEFAGRASSATSASQLLLARGYVSLADVAGEKFGGQEYIKTAELLYREMADSDDLENQKQAAAFFFNHDKQFAEQLLRRIIANNPTAHDAEQLLAMLLATNAASPATYDEIMQLLSRDDAEPADDRLKAILLYNRGGAASQKEALRLLQALAGDAKQVAPIDRLLLARLYANQGELAAAREQLKILVSVEHPAAEHLAAYIDNLLRSERPTEARTPLKQLADLEPSDRSLRTLTLQCRWLVAVGHQNEVRPLIDAFLAAQRDAKSDNATEGRLLIAAADLVASLELNDAAETFYRQAFAADTAAHAALATWLNKRGRTSDAVQVCLQAAERDTGPLPAIVLTNVLTIGAPSESDLQAAEPLLRTANERHAKSPALVFARGTRHLMNGEAEEAVRCFRQVLEIRPTEVQAMNNLSIALSMRPEGLDEALEWIDKAIAAAGPNSELLDSKGWILMLRRNLPEAAEVLTEALPNLPGDPRHRFHLAVVYQHQQKLKEAAEQLGLARQGRLQEDLLSPAERAELVKLNAALAAGTRLKQ